MPFFSFWFQCRTVQSPQFQETRTFQIQVKSTDLDTKSHLNAIKATTRKAWLPKCVFLGDGPCCLSNVLVSNLCSSWDNFWVLVLFCLLDCADPHSKIHMLRAHRFSDVNLWHLEPITCQKNSGSFVFGHFSSESKTIISQMLFQSNWRFVGVIYFSYFSAKCPKCFTEICPKKVISFLYWITLLGFPRDNLANWLYLVKLFNFLSWGLKDLLLHLFRRVCCVSS